MLRAVKKNPVTLRLARRDPASRGRAADPPPERLTDRLDVVRVAGFDVVRVRPSSASAGGSGATTAPGALVYLYGGAFRSGIAKQHWHLIAELSDATGRDVYVPRYGLLPEYTSEDAAPFLAAVREWLRGAGPLHVIGDSSGGNLALLMAQSEKRPTSGDRTTAGIVGMTLIAPWLDLSISNPRVPEVARTDPWLDPERYRPLGRAWAAGRDPRDPAVSPIFGDLTGLPPTAVFVGTRDLCVVDCEVLAERAPSVRLHAEKGSPHVFPLLPTPEGRAGRAAIIRFVAETFG